jgi:mRNA interferase RelE/StbE
MKFKILFSKKATKEFEKLDHSIKKRIDLAIKEKLEIAPNNHLIPLTGSLKSLYKFRVGDYRLICKKEDDKLIILIVTIKIEKKFITALSNKS